MEGDLSGHWLTVLFCTTGIFTALQLARAEWRRYQAPRAGEEAFSSASRLLRRLAGSVLLGLLLALLLLGVVAIDFSGNLPLALAYWGVFSVLLLVLFAVGLADWLDTKRLLHHQRSRILKALARRAEESAPPSDTAGTASEQGR